MTTEIDRKLMKAIRESIETALAEIAEKFEIQIKLGRGTYYGKFNLELSAISETGEIFTEEAKAYKSNVGQKGGALESFDSDWLFKKFEYAKKTYKLMGFNTRASKNNMLIQDVATDKRYTLRSTSLLKAFEEQHRDLDGWDLHRVAKENKVDIARSLIARGDDIEAKSQYGATPLFMAATQNSLEVARLLIDSGADIEAKNNDDWTPLHLTAFGNSLDVARLLIDRGADIESKTNDGMTPLRMATEENSLDVATLLIDKGANWEGIDLSWMDEQHRPKETPEVEVERVLRQAREAEATREAEAREAEATREAEDQSRERARQEHIDYIRDNKDR